MMASGYSQLHRTLTQHIQRTAEKPSVLDLGTIQSDMSLKLDRFGHALAQGDYLICRGLTLNDPMVATNPGGTDNHTHTVPPPAQLAPLAPGDRVLAAWVGRDAVIIDKVVS